MLSFVISDTGANPLVAYNGQECIDIVKKQHVDMILMDYIMPVMDGIEATKIVRSLSQGEKIVIIGITVYDDDNDAKRSIEAGMDMLFPKQELTDGKLLEIGQKYFADGNSETPVDEITNNTSRKFKNTEGVLSGINGNDNAVMDYEEVLGEFDNNEEILIHLIVEFDKTIEDKLSIMWTAFKNSDFKSVQKEAHGIRGGAANLSAGPLENAAELLEKACKQGSEAVVVEDLLNKLAEKIEEFKSYVENRVNINKKEQPS
jgi:CheY-like chemotaxis protein/HPt (histidine-containing phosphotransfer) domain-containing protein